jgi:hypothetical protein
MNCLNANVCSIRFAPTKIENEMVGTAGFEPATPGPPDQCATGLRYAPTWRFSINQTVKRSNFYRQARLAIQQKFRPI